MTKYISLLHFNFLEDNIDILNNNRIGWISISSIIITGKKQIIIIEFAEIIYIPKSMGYTSFILNYYL